MTNEQLFGLFCVFFLLGTIFAGILLFSIGCILEFKEERKKIINYLKVNNNYNMPYMLVYKNLTREEKREILKKVGNK